MKKYYEMSDVGKVKYLVNFHNGIKLHNDGSKFYDIKLFKNKQDKNKFIQQLTKDGYIKVR